jgi:hypothetical protein
MRTTDIQPTMDRVRTIAIVLGDNDFGNTFRPLLEGLKAVLEHHEDRNGFSLTPEQIELVIRQSVSAYYVGFQYHFEPGSYGDSSKTHEEHIAKTAAYLKDIRVLFDDAAEADIATADHDGGAWYLELQSGTVSGY